MARPDPKRDRADAEAVKAAMMGEILEQQMPTFIVSAENFRELAKRQGWEPRTLDLLFRGGPPVDPVRMGECLYQIT